MRKNVVAPSVGESITEVSILKWTRKNGEAVKTGDLLLEIESDKATVEIIAESPGTLQILKPAGERIPIGEIVGFVDDSIPATAGTPPLPSATPPMTMPPIPGTSASAPSMPPPLPSSTTPSAFPALPMSPTPPPVPSAAAGLSPAVRRASASHGVDPSTVPGTGKDGRVTKGDILIAGTLPSAAATTHAPTSAPPAPVASTPTPAASAPAPVAAASTVKSPALTDKPGDRRVPMSMLRSKIAERLVYAQHTAAILTTFNEVDMTAVMKLRSEQKDAFKAKHGVNLSFMSFFAKASIAALKAVPEVNAMIDGKDTVYHDYYDIGIAVGTERGLVVPVIRNADQLSFVDFERKIAELAIKGRDGKLSMADLTGGTFTISNGGTYGSLMSTPILNPPQSGILGMHKIMDRPVAVNGKVEIRPMMYTALSYDHRIVDGKGAVTWLVALKDFLENPEKLGFTL